MFAGFTLLLLTLGLAVRSAVLPTDGDLLIGRNSPSLTLTTAGIADAHHQLMIASGLYTQADADRVDALGFDYYNKTFGLDFLTHGVPYNAGVPGLNALLLFGSDGFPLAIWLPYKGGTLYDLLLVQNNDRQNIQSSKKPWAGFQFGSVVQMLRNGAFAGGSRVGTGYRAKELLSLFFYTFADVLQQFKDGSLDSSLVGVAAAAGNKRDDILVRTHWPISFVYDFAIPTAWNYYANVAEAFDTIGYNYETTSFRKGDFNEIISIVEEQDSGSNVRNTQQYRSWVNWRSNPLKK